MIKDDKIYSWNYIEIEIMNRKGTVKVNLCNTDNDCKRKNQMCGFDTNDLKHKLSLIHI